MRGIDYFYVLILPIITANFVMTSQNQDKDHTSLALDCKLHAVTISSEIECIYQNSKNWNLSGITVRATAPEGNLTQGEIVFETLILSGGESRLQFKEGFGVEVFNSLQHSLGFNVKVITAKGWATQYPNKSWFGMAQQVIDGFADLSLAKTSILPNRAEDLGYLVPTHGLGLYAFFIQPSFKTGRNIFLEPFSTPLWICLLVVYIILMISIRVISTCAEKTIGLEPEDHILSEQIVIWSCHTICQHGFHSPPKMTCLRVAIVTGVVLGLILYVSYSAQLVSIFSISTVPIKNIEDLLKSKINVMVDENNQRARNMIEGQSINGPNPDPISIRLTTHVKSQKKRLAPAAAGGGAILHADSAVPSSFITFKDTFYTTIKNTLRTGDDELCLKIATVPVTGTTFKSGLFVKKGSFFKEPFNVKIITMYNAGLMGRFVTKYEETYTPRCDKDKATLVPIITVSEVAFVFYGLAIGFILAVGICLFEFLMKRISPYVNYLIVCVGAVFKEPNEFE